LRRVRAAPIALLLVLLSVAPAHAADPRTSPRLWATVNVCDTERNPDTLGIRASMPGSGRKRESMWMRFRVQYFSQREQLWHNFTVKGTDSGAVRVASHARYKRREAGFLFPFTPEVGDRYVLRGSVEFQWRRGGRVVRRVKELTTGNHKPAVADPKGYSAATCEILG
jgi:hypothetical protein